MLVGGLPLGSAAAAGGPPKQATAPAKSAPATSTPAKSAPAKSAPAKTAATPAPQSPAATAGEPGDSTGAKASAAPAAPATTSNSAPGSHKVVIDLFPKDALQNSLQDPYGLTSGKSQNRRERPPPGIPLGDDTHWAAHAVQAGVMGGLFATFAALCGGGNCLLPGAKMPALSPQPRGPEASAPTRGRTGR